MQPSLLTMPERLLTTPDALSALPAVTSKPATILSTAIPGLDPQLPGQARMDRSVTSESDLSDAAAGKEPRKRRSHSSHVATTDVPQLRQFHRAVVLLRIGLEVQTPPFCHPYNPFTYP